MFYSLHFRKRELLILKCFFYLFRLLLNKLKELVSPILFVYDIFDGKNFQIKNFMWGKPISNTIYISSFLVMNFLSD